MGRFSRRRGWRPPKAVNNVWWLVLGACTFGLIYPIPAIMCWVRARRFRSPSMTQPPARAWLVWAVVFSLLTVGSYTGLIILGGSSGGSPAAYVPPTTATVSLGTTVSLLAEVGSPHGESAATLSVAVSRPTPQAHSKVADVNFTARLHVCAAGDAIDPLSVAVGITLITTSGKSASPAADWLLPEGFYSGRLAPHDCLVGNLGYHVAAGETARKFSFEGFAGKNVEWTAR